MASDADSVAELLLLHEVLATDVAEHEAHTLEGLTELIWHKQRIEDRIKALDPEVFDVHWAEWLRRDVDLAHLSEDGHRVCRTCQTLRSYPSSAA